MRTPASARASAAARFASLNAGSPIFALSTPGDGGRKFVAVVRETDYIARAISVWVRAAVGDVVVVVVASDA
jgi:hypothetical protein